jgi:hypothetical protein
MVSEFETLFCLSSHFVCYPYSMILHIFIQTSQKLNGIKNILYTYLFIYNLNFMISSFVILERGEERLVFHSDRYGTEPF